MHLVQGNFEAAISALESSLAVSRAADERDWSVLTSAALGEAYARAARIAEGVALLEETSRDALDGGAASTQFGLDQRLAAVYLLAKRLDDALRHTRRSLHAARQQNARGLEASSLFTMGEIHRSTDFAQVERAAPAYQEALALAQSCGMRPLSAHCHLGLAKMCWKAGRPRESQDHLAIATTSLYRDMDMRSWLAQADQWTAGTTLS